MPLTIGAIAIFGMTTLPVSLHSVGNSTANDEQQAILLAFETAQKLTEDDKTVATTSEPLPKEHDQAFLSDMLSIPTSGFLRRHANDSRLKVKTPPYYPRIPNRVEVVARGLGVN